MLGWLDSHEGTGTWIAAIATLLAILVSLWLARRDGRTRLNVFVDVRIASLIPGCDPIRQLVVVVANAGLRPVVIKSLGYSLWPRVWPMHVLAADQSIGAAPHHRLEHGEEVEFRLALDHWVDELVRVVANTQWQRCRLRFHVVTTLGYRVSCRPGPLLRRWLRDYGKPLTPLKTSIRSGLRLKQ